MIFLSLNGSWSHGVGRITYRYASAYYGVHELGSGFCQPIYSRSQREAWIAYLIKDVFAVTLLGTLVDQDKLEIYYCPKSNYLMLEI